ncbi:MAG TPA: chloride channel protein, partial [Terracidiphilus sp.]
ATIISYASGNAGGIFAPSLYLGAMAGGTIGVLMHRFAPFPTGDPGAYALVGMGTLFAGIIRAPMTSVFMIFELTQDYQVLVPLMIANMISFLISTHYQPMPLYHALLQQDRVHLPAPGARMPVGSWRARDLMLREFTLIPPDISIEQAAKEAASADARCFLVGNNGVYSGLVTRHRIDQALGSGAAESPIATIVTKEHAHVHPDQSIEVVLDRLAQSAGLLPVVSRNQVSRVEGVITPQTLIQFVQRNLKDQSPDSTTSEEPG